MRRARAGAKLVVTPEMSLSGYPAEDLWLRDDFCDQCAAELMKLAPYCLDVAVIVGYPHREGRTRYNAAAVLRGGRIEQFYFKQKLPNYNVFDEKRYFEAGNRPCVFELEGRKIGLTICEDLWFPEPAAQAKAAGAQLLLSINASPFHRAQQAERYQEMGARVKETGLPLLYVHGVGGQDELVFDGASFALDAEGMLSYQAETFREAIDIVELDGDAVKGPMAPPLTEEETIYRALMTGTADYVNKNGFPGVLLGLSGGIDSALVLAVCVDALGAERVHAVMMPSDYTASMSVEDAREMAEIFGVKYTEIAIKPVFDAFRAQLAPSFAGRAEDTTEENLQSRIRGTLLMALSNKSGAIVVTTGNKSEMATGYCDALRRHGGRLRGDQGHREDAGLPPGVLAQHQGARHPAARHRPPAHRRASARPDRPGQPAALRGARRRGRALHGARPLARADRQRGLRPRDGAPSRAPHPAERIQAPPGAAGRAHHAARLWQGLALSDNIRFPTEGLRQLPP